MSKKDRTVWLDRGWQPLAIGFVPGKKAWERTAKKHRLDSAWPDIPGRAGHTEWVRNDKTGEGFILVVIGKDAEYSAPEVISTIVHEAVHVWQFICQHIGEDAPGIEMEAYGIQSITVGLLDAYSRTQGKGKDWS